MILELTPKPQIKSPDGRLLFWDDDPEVVRSVFEVWQSPLDSDEGHMAVRTALKMGAAEGTPVWEFAVSGVIQTEDQRGAIVTAAHQSLPGTNLEARVFIANLLKVALATGLGRSVFDPEGTDGTQNGDPDPS